MVRTSSAPSGQASRSMPLTEADIEAQTDGGSYSRGRTYFRQGRIHETVLRDDTIEALCQGSDYAPYRVRATLLSRGESGENPRDFSCTCPRGGFCKHIVALLLTWIDDPDRFEVRRPLADQLGERSREELIAMIRQMVARYPDLERIVDMPMPVPPGKAGSGSSTTVTIDAKAIRKQVRSMLSGFDYHEWDAWEWGHAYGAFPELRQTLELGQSYADVGQWANAQVVFSALAEEVGDVLVEYGDNEGGELSGIVIDADEGLAACLDAQEQLAEDERLSSEAREELIHAIYEIWRRDIFDIGGIDLSQHGVDSVIRNVTDDERTMVEAWLRGEQADGWSQGARTGFLVDLRETAGASDEELLALFREAELWDEVVSMLLSMDRVDEAVATATRHIRMPHSLIAFANALIARGSEHINRAIALVDDRAWEIEGQNVAHDAMLQDWLVAQYSAHGRSGEALKLAEQRFRREPTLRHYRAVRDAAHLSGQPRGIWRDLRPKLLDHLRESEAWSDLVEIYLEDGSVAAALDAFDNVTRQREQRMQGMWVPMAWGYGDQELRLAQAAETDFPDWAVSVYRRKAEEQIGRRQRSSYQVAAGHLARVKETLERHGRADEWKGLITEVRTTHKTLRALREELDNLDLH